MEASLVSSFKQQIDECQACRQLLDVFVLWTCSLVAQDLISQLLVRHPEDRLGCGNFGVRAIKNHPFFSRQGFDWVRIQIILRFLSTLIFMDPPSGR